MNAPQVAGRPLGAPNQTQGGRTGGPALPLSKALAWAIKTTEWLAPYCERIEIAGSIRRRRPFCNDIDLVVIPKEEATKDLMGETIAVRYPIVQFLHEYVQENAARGATWLAGHADSPDQVMVQLASGVQLDVFFSRADRWGTRLVCRTGSKEHNIHLCMEAQKRGLHWNPYKGVRQGIGFAAAPTEEDVFAQLGVPFVAPERRER